MKKVLFIDRDGTLIKETSDEQIDSFQKLEFYPKVFSGLGKIIEKLDFEIVMITNQDGLGTDTFPEETFWPVHTFILKTFENEGIFFDEIFIDRTFPEENANTRKPKVGLLSKYFSEDYDLANSFVIGDRLTDMVLAKNVGAKGIYINDQTFLGTNEISINASDLSEHIVLESTNWLEICTFLSAPNRTAKVERITNETNVEIQVNLDGSGVAKINTGIAFFDHMLEQVARHGQLDLSIRSVGDLEVDEHHTIEDTGIALGEAFSQALTNKLGMERYGFCLPMDDCLAQVAIDFGGRNWLVWDAVFNREMIGKMPTEMFFHFFKSFTDGAKATVNIQAKGVNEHHKIEAIFKAFAKAIRMAIQRDVEKGVLPSTKGLL